MIVPPTGPAIYFLFASELVDLAESGSLRGLGLDIVNGVVGVFAAVVKSDVRF